MIEPAQEKGLDPEIGPYIRTLLEAFGARRTELSASRTRYRARLSQGEVAFLADTAHVRDAEWQVAKAPSSLTERRVELIGGATRPELVNGLNSGAKNYIADLWNFTNGEAFNILRAHRNLERAARMDLAYLPPESGRIRIDPASDTKLQIGLRPLHVLESALSIDDEPVPAAFFDLTSVAFQCGRALRERQGGVFLYLRDVQTQLEARLWAQLFQQVEGSLGWPRGTIRATIVIDSIPGALEAEEILFELVHHACGLSMDPQAYAADHIALFTAPDRHTLPDRETIGLNAPFLRALSLYLIGVAHKRGCHAIGGPSFVLPPKDPEKVKGDHLEMLADKEREAVDGHDGTIVAHPDHVNAAMVEFNKSMPKANQLYYMRYEATTAADLIRRPEGSITVDSLVSMIRTVLRYQVQHGGGSGWAIQGGRIHDRSSLRFAIRLLWQWARSQHGVITATGLDVHQDLLKYLFRKEAGKMFADRDDQVRKRADAAVERTLELLHSEALPLEPLS
ncbi:MAG: hypothetical protein KDB84_03790 [Flavobacteriales bacterium]|nr:hypothetical protein [Flavobacteriales bacterium]